jgi:signal transduction histidine kinase
MFPDSRKALQLFRIAQEAVHNAVRHGEAKNIRISLALFSQKGCLTVFNDGFGFAPASVRHRSRGLQTIRFRTRLIGGAFKIISEPGKKGVKIRCRFPLLPAEEGK